MTATGEVRSDARSSPFVGRYRVTSSHGALDEGAFCDAVDVATGAHVTLKWLPRFFALDVDKLRTEVRRWTGIRHTHVATILSLEEHEGQAILVMERLRGESLRSRLDRGPLSPEEACKLMLAVAQAVATAHSQGVLHGDLKPESIFLEQPANGNAPSPKVLDFAVARLMTDAARLLSNTLHTDLLSAYEYMSLEQLHMRRDIDGRADVYALGVILYQMLTGRLPYEAHNAVDLALKVGHGAFRPVTDHKPCVSAQLADVVHKAIARDRESRHVTVYALVAELQAIVEGGRGAAGVGGASMRERARSALSERKRWVVLALPDAVVPTPLLWLAKVRERPRWMLAGFLSLGAIVLAWFFYALAP